MVTAAVAFCLGAAAVIAQLELLREYLGLAGGSEVAWGLSLGAWLAAGGVGSLAASRLRRARWVGATAAFGAFAASYVFGLWLIWGGRGILGAAPGELISWLRAFGFAFAAMGPPAFFVGATFVFVAAASREAKVVYVGEATGACVAGLLFTVLLSRWFTPITAAALIFFAAAAAAALASRRRLPAVLFAAAALAAGILTLSSPNVLTERWFFARSFPAEEVLDYRTSPYGAVVATARAGQFSLYENGLLVSSYPHRLAAEETVHPAMLLRPGATRVVLFGGGLNGALAEFAKYRSVREIRYVELDAALVAAARATYYPTITSSPGVRFIAADGRRWARRARGKGIRADVVIVAMPLPASAQVNRYFTREFFADVRGLLAPGGVLAFSAPGAANYYPPELAAFLSTTRRTAAEVFRYVEILPGERFLFLAADVPLDTSAAAYRRALAKAAIRNTYFTPAYFQFRLTPDRLAAARRATTLAAPPNVDLKPAGLYYGMTLWAARVGGGERKVLAAARRVKLWYIILFAAALATPWFVGRRRLGGRPALILALVVQGFIELSLEIFIILGFQVVYGAAYLELALIVGAFMAGLAVGGVLPRAGTAAAGRRALVVILGCTVVIAAALPLILIIFSRWSASPTWAVHVVFGALALAAGMCGGAQFVVALRLWGAGGAGVLYGADMAGSALGAVAASAVFVPVLGFAQGAAALAALAVAAAAALSVARPRAAT